MEHCRERGLCKSIGVMNCPVVMFLEILTFCHKRPAINVLESHPYFNQDAAVDFYRRLEIPVAAYAPLCPQEHSKFVLASEKFKNLDLFKEKVVLDLAKKYNKSCAQILLNWHMRKNHIIFPGMGGKEEFEQNAEIFEFELAADEVKQIDALNKDLRFYETIQDQNYGYIPYWM